MTSLSQKGSGVISVLGRIKEEGWKEGKKHWLKIDLGDKHIKILSPFCDSVGQTRQFSSDTDAQLRNLYTHKSSLGNRNVVCGD